MKLNFEGMTEEQIEEFANSVEIYVEVDATERFIIKRDGETDYGPVEVQAGTGYLMCWLFGFEVNNNFGINQEDVADKCLELYRENHFNYDLTKEAIVKEFGRYAD